MANAGMSEALSRGVLALRRRGVVVDLPPWVTMLNFIHAASYADPWRAGNIILCLRTIERRLRERSAQRAPAHAKWTIEDAQEDVPALPSWAADTDTAQINMVIALTRMQLGAAIEATLAEEALDCNTPGSRTGCDPLEAARRYNDAFLVAVWTSAHASYVASIQSGVEEPPPPGLNSIPNSASEFDFSDLYSRRTCARLCPKGSNSLLSVFMRSTNPGSRGWNTLLNSALEESMATRLTITNTLVIALSGMHPHLHPAMRPPWWMRQRMCRVAQHALTDASSRKALTETAAATKEAVRRLLSSTVSSSLAMFAALAYVGHPVGHLTTPPSALPAVGMEGAMSAFVHAGIRLMECQTPEASYTHIVNDSFEQHLAREDDDVTHVQQTAVVWDAPWLGKGTASGVLS